MPPLNFSKLLRSHLASLASAFDPDELAYLAMTGKIEHAVRDRLAFSIYTEFKAKSLPLIVAREWKRVDLAILEGKTPCMFLELKAMYSYNMFSPKATTQFPGAIADDLEKLKLLDKNLLSPPSEHFALAILTHPHAMPNDFEKSVVKYSRGIHKFRPPSISKLRAATLENFSKHTTFKLRNLSSGVAFGVKVTVYYCLFGPYQSEA